MSRGGHDEARAGHKLKQLCREVERTVSYALGASDDPILQGLVVVAVEPAPDASRLEVIVANPVPGENAVDILSHLEHARGRLRADVAHALERKRTPELIFRLAAPPTGEE